MKILTPEDKKWGRFCKLLDKELASEDCDAVSFSLSRRILEKHFSDYDIEKTFEFFTNHAAYCDCEVLLNITGLEGTYEHNVPRNSVQKMDDSNDFSRRINDPDATHSNKFPYLVERIIPAFYNIIPRSEDTPIEDLVSEAKDLSTESEHRVCVVLGPTRALYVELDGSVNESDSIPSGGLALQLMKDNVSRKHEFRKKPKKSKGMRKKFNPNSGNTL